MFSFARAIVRRQGFGSSTPWMHHNTLSTAVSRSSWRLLSTNPPLEPPMATTADMPAPPPAVPKKTRKKKSLSTTGEDGKSMPGAAVGTSEILRFVAEAHSLTQAETRRIYDSIINVVCEVRYGHTKNRKKYVSCQHTLVFVFSYLIFFVLCSFPCLFAFKSLTLQKKVTLIHLGAFETYKTKARTARNPRTGEPINVPEGLRVRFRPNVSFKRTVLGKAIPVKAKVSKGKE
jgi:hypothetical protein